MTWAISLCLSLLFLAYYRIVQGWFYFSLGIFDGIIKFNSTLLMATQRKLINKFQNSQNEYGDRSYRWRGSENIRSVSLKFQNEKPNWTKRIIDAISQAQTIVRIHFQF